MKSALLVIPFLLVGLVPVAFGQVVETTGQNYDLIEDYNIGEAKWTSHPERIMVNGEWENYFLQANDQQIIFRSNSVGGFIYDIPSCSYSIYDNGFNGNQIIPSVSSVASYNVNGNWQNMAVNQEECLVNFSQGDNGIFITSTKTLFGQENQPIFFGFNGTGSTVNVNGTSYNVVSNGNQTGYYVDNFVNVETEKFVQELKVDIFGGIKETFKVWNESDEPLGISQTVHTGESITIGENTLNIAELNGQSFNKQFLEDNQAQVFEIAESVNYDFKDGFDSLSNVNIFFDGNYKVNLDYASGDFVNYLEIDPTFSSSSSSLDGIIQTALTTGTSCNLNTVQSQPYSRTSQYLETYLYASSLNQVCYLPFVMFDVSSIPSSATVTDSVFKYEVDLVLNPRNIDIVGVTADTGSTDQQILTAFGSATTLVSNESGFTSVGANKSVDLTSNGDSYIQNKISTGDEVVFLFPFNSMTRDGSSHVVNFVSSDNTGSTRQKPTLEVTYTVPTAPQPPTNLQTVTGIPIEVSWTAPVDDGGSSITGYKVYRTLNQYVMTELPNNGGTTPVDFTDNELLLHGESFGGQPDYSDNFSTDTNWTKTGTLIDVEPTTNKRLDFTASTNGVIHGEVWDLGSTLSNSNWILRYKLDLTTVSNSGDANTKRFFFGLDSTSGMDSTTANHYFTGMYLQKGNSGEYIRLTTRENANLDDSLGTATSVSLSSNTQYWVEIKRTSSTSVTLSVYSDSDYSTLVNSVSRTLTNMNNLQYLKAVNSKISTPSTATLTGFIDDVVIYDGVTSVPTPTATDNSPNTLTVTANTGTLTTGQISNAISTPNLEVTSSLLPDGTDSFTVGSWVKQALTRDSTLDGTNNGATTGQTGKIGNAWSTSGTQYVLMNTNPTFIGTSDFTTNYWVKTTGTSQAHWGVNSGTGELMAFINANGKIVYSLGIYYVNTSTASINDGNWHMITFTRDFNGATTKLYVDGVLDQTNTSNTGTNGNKYDINNSYPLALFGRNISGTIDVKASATLDEFAIWNRELTSNEISNLYNSGSGTTTIPQNDLKVHYDFEQTGSTLENQVFNPPTNTKLLGFTNSNGGDISFNVGTTTADFSVTSPTTYKVHSFTSDGTFSISSGSGNVDYLIVGGGGGGSHGGGGAGGFLEGTTSVSSQSYSIVVGQGGSGFVATESKKGGNGGSSSFNGLTAVGGGGGGGFVSGGLDGSSGGSGGGAAGEYSSWGLGSAGSGTTGQGYAGGSANNASPAGAGGGGGGAGGVGGSANSSLVAGNGGVGKYSSITGTQVMYACGGGGGTWQASGAGVGGCSSAGDGFTRLGGSSSTTLGVDGTGSGGGGLWDANKAGSSYGGDGIVVIAYVDDGSITATGGTITTYQSGSSTTDIVSATGLTDNTSAFQHYALSRDGSSWTLYQNGQSIATATDSTDLGTVSGSHKINIDGSIDEYFIDSTALTSNEIETVYGMGSEPSLLTTTGTTTSYDDSGVIGGNTYYYYVKATNAIGDSDFSAQVSGLAGTPPDAPTGLSASIQNTNTAPRDIFLQWSAPTNVGSGTLTGFEIWRDGSLVTTVGLISSYVDIVPTVGTYTYTVKAVSTHGTSVDSNSAQITTPNLPDAPQGLTLSIDNPDPSPLTVTVTVSPPLNDGGSAVTGYNIYTSTDDITYTLQASNTSNPSNITVSSAGLWYFKAEAVNGVGAGALSSNAIIGTPNVPDAPTSVTTNIPDVNNAPSSVVVAWSNGLTNGGSAITGYNVYRDGSLLTSLGTGIFTYTDTATKTASTSYTYEVRITNNVGESLGTQSSITTPSPPNAPVLSVETGTTKATWTVPTSDATITNYKLYRDGSLVATLSGSTTTYIDRTLIIFGNSYDYQVSAVSSIGEGTLSNTVTTTPDTEVDDATAFGTTGTSSIIDWTEPPYFQGEVTSYSVYYSTPYSSNPSTLIGTTGNTYLNLYNQLQYDTNYAFMVLVNSPLGNTSVGNVVNATTTENLGIVTFDPTTGSDWFDIDAVNQEELNLTTYTRTEGNGGTLLGITYPTNYESMTCDINYRFGQETLQYVEGEDITATPIDAAKQLMVFQFNNQDSEVIYIECADQSVPNSSSSYTLTTTFGNFPLLTQIDNFRSGEYGTEGLFGSLDLITLFVVIISMVGFNRVSPIAGVIIGVSALLGMAYFEITSLPATLIGVFALIAFLAWGVTRK